MCVSCVCVCVCVTPEYKLRDLILPCCSRLLHDLNRGPVSLHCHLHIPLANCLVIQAMMGTAKLQKPTTWAPLTPPPAARTYWPLAQLRAGWVGVGC
jgi:hypothetical protein